MIPSGVERWAIPTPFPVGDVNAWYLPGRVPALIDPGPRTPEAWRALEPHLRDHPVAVVVFTHHHVDHAGLAHRLQRDHGVRVVAHEAEAEILAHWGARAQERERDYEAGLVRAAVPEHHRERMRYGGRRFDSYAEGVQADRRVRDGDTIALGDRDFEVVHAPGHTAGSTLLCAPDGAFTFSGDTLLERITPNALSVRASERSALPDYLASLERLARRDLGTILPGHGPTFHDAGKVISAGLRHAELRRARIVRLLAERADTAFGVAQRLFPALPDNQLFLAVSETLGHLECLRRDGRTSVDAAGPADVYGAAQV